MPTVKDFYAMGILTIIGKGKSQKTQNGEYEKEETIQMTVML